MKFKLHGMVFSLLFALGLAFSFSIEAGADDGEDGQGIKAEDVDPGNQEQMEMFLTHIVNYHNGVLAETMGEEISVRARALTLFARDIRQSETYHHDDVYGIMINSRTMRVVNHAKHPGLLGYKFNPDSGNSDVAGAMQALIDGFASEPMPCRNYQYEGQNRVACATKAQSLVGEVTVVAGLHHTRDDAPFEPPNCPDFGFTLGTTAQQVYENPTDANLEAYVKGVIEVTQKEMQDATTAVVNEDPAAILPIFAPTTPPAERAAAAQTFQGKISERFSERIACYGLRDFKHGNIYVFIMSTDPAGTVLLNGNNFDLNGLNLEADDDELPGDDKSIAGLFRNALTGGSREPEAGDSATVNYRWDDPDDPDDTIPNWFEMGSVPGSSPKTSYIEVANLFEDYNISIPGGPSFPFPPQLLIFGSGTYPEEDDDGACAIAGIGHTSQSTLLNLFLVASVLFSVVFLRRRV